MLSLWHRIFRRQEPCPPAGSIVALDRSEDLGPFHVATSMSDTAQCVRLRDGHIHRIQRGTFPRLLDGPDFIMASSALAEVLRTSCSHCLQFVPAQVVNVQTEKILAQYIELRPHDEVTPETISEIDVSGARVWHFAHSHLFATRKVMLEIENARIGDLQFTPGFQDFAG